MAEEYYEGRSKCHAKPSLLMRLAAGVWFGITFLIPAFLYFWHERSAFSPLLTEEFVLAVVLPAAITALFGSVFGARILMVPKDHTGLLVTLRGSLVGSISYPLILVVWAAYKSLESYNRFSEFAWVLSYGFLTSIYFILPFMIMIGAISGWLLHCLGKMFVTTLRPKLSELEAFSGRDI